MGDKNNDDDNDNDDEDDHNRKKINQNPTNEDSSLIAFCPRNTTEKEINNQVNKTS